MHLLSPPEAQRVAKAVVADRIHELPGSLLARSGLAGLALLGDGKKFIEEPRVVQAFAGAMMRHTLIRQELGGLLGSWASEGIHVLIFKGFSLAEWLYDHPGQRPYNDVDLVVHEVDAKRAEAVGVELGWRTTWSRRFSSMPFKHSEFEMISPSGMTHLDVHRFIAHCASPFDGVQRRITGAAWAESREAVLDGTRVRVLRPEDAILLGLVLNRFWSPDELTPKPHDYFDIQRVVERSAMDERDVAERAKELSCERTWRLFLARCDPWRRHLELTRPNLPTRQWFSAQIALERPHPQVEDVLMRFLRWGTRMFST